MRVIINGRDLINSTYYEAYETENHVHNNSVTFGLNATEDSLTPYIIQSGNGVYGAEVLILDTANTPFRTGKKYFDFHKMLTTDISSTNPYIVRFAYGTGTFASAIADFQFTTFGLIKPGVGNVKADAYDILSKHLPIATKIWGQCKCETNLATINCLFSIHEYDNPI